jgi:hypothetical protein
MDFAEMMEKLPKKVVQIPSHHPVGDREARIWYSGKRIATMLLLPHMKTSKGSYQNGRVITGARCNNKAEYTSSPGTMCLKQKTFV